MLGSAQIRSGILSVLLRGRFVIFNKPSLKQRVIKAFISAVADGEAFPKIDKNTTCSRHVLFAIASELDESIPWHLCKRLGVPKGSTYSDAAVAAALRETGKAPGRVRPSSPLPPTR
jgi:hypothetical protein